MHSLLNCPHEEENALKAKLRRLCESKNGKLNVPEWLHEQWKTGDHLSMARELESCNFNKAHFFAKYLFQ
jgi:hypothetical protein